MDGEQLKTMLTAAVVDGVSAGLDSVADWRDALTLVKLFLTYHSAWSPRISTLAKSTEP
jgi:hypothetical protein